MLDTLNDIYYCRDGKEHPWAPDVDTWKVSLALAKNPFGIFDSPPFSSPGRPLPRDQGLREGRKAARVVVRRIRRIVKRGGGGKSRTDQKTFEVHRARIFILMMTTGRKLIASLRKDSSHPGVRRLV